MRTSTSVERQFAVFLEDEGITEIFVNELLEGDYRSNLEELFVHTDADDFLCEAFDWDDSMDGWNFWDDTNDRWNRELFK